MVRGLAATGPILAFVTGFVDTAVFVHMGGLFVAHVTGNLVLLGVALAGGAQAEGHAGTVGLQLLTFPVFVTSAALGALVLDRRQPGAALPMPRLLWLAAIVMTAALGLAVLRAQGSEAAITLVVAMGLLNALHRLDSRMGPPFTVMTGNVTALAIVGAQALGLARSLPPASGTGRIAALVLAFAVGAVLGALADHRFGLLAIALPTFVLTGHLAFGLRLEAAA
jgi:uncharacterized membrane protein YoaK (UPF0700 family)